MGNFGRIVLLASGLAAVGAAAHTVNLPASLVASTETVKNIVTTGPQTAEGPVWDPVGNVLYFSDYANLTHNQGSIWKVPGGTGTATQFKTGLDVPCGMKIDNQDKLVYGEWNKISSMQLPSGSPIALATASAAAGATFPTGRTVNDLSLAPDGGVFFTYNEWSSESYVYYLPAGGTPQKKLTFASNYFPNGIIYVAEKNILYVNFSQQNSNNIKKYQVDAQGNLTNPANFANVNGPDGMTLDEYGNIYMASAAPASVSVLDSTGKTLGTITLNPGSGNITATNVCFGGTDNQTLFMTGDTYVFSLHMSVKGRATTGVAPRAERLAPIARAPLPSALLWLSGERNTAQGNSGALYSFTGRRVGYSGRLDGAISKNASGIFFVMPAR
jgi:sugar lactone lactonase YvrE